MLEPYPRMVLEYLPCGDLCHLLHPLPGESVPAEQFPWELRIAIAWDIAKGMNYLQTRSPPVIHRDLRSPNIFVRSPFSERERERASAHAPDSYDSIVLHECSWLHWTRAPPSVPRSQTLV